MSRAKKPSKAPQEQPQPQLKKRKRNSIPPQEKCRAVLAVWSERRKPSEICRELQISWAQLNNWQDQALTGMLQALTPRQPSSQKPALSDRLQKLLAKRLPKGEEAADVLSARLQKRLRSVQETSPQKDA